ncbi:hypothetical protein [Natronocalculus amylovorans]|uniref:Uncharacterized protein n=1 Tax=Natronocalculus amylovorans TaxID=2917812 RepID=A0AAE3FZW7_9EURY|nr:hypothetical protein [Natronocalculus amylovorans]MCL9818088.1 hypothetical protein [Natronocalculus amylovorans]NUE03917.1 hypothetical protein [Halorubraceae archaeon YAN]
MNSEERSQIATAIALTVGFISLGIGVLVAYTNPATEYELSIYASTPLVFWIAVIFATAVSMAAVASQKDKVLTASGYILALGSVISVVSLPLIRNYYYYGAGDSMSHLGWAREIGSGVLSPLGLLYPGTHITANYMSEVSGMGLTQALQWIPMVIYPLIGMVSIGMCIAYLTDSRWGLPVGIFSGLLLVPINKLSVHIISHPSSQAILFFGFVLFLLFLFLTQQSERTLLSPISLLLLLVALSMVFIHPQEAMMMIVTLLTIAGVQLVFRRKRPSSEIAGQPLPILHGLAALSLFAVWVPQHARPVDRFSFVLDSFFEQGSTTGTEVEARTGSLATLGASVEELFVKLFLVTLIFSLLGIVLLLLNLRGNLPDTETQRNSIITYLTVVFFPLTMAVGVVFLANQGDHYFRFFGFLMVPVTIVGGVALVELFSTLDLRLPRAATVSSFVIIFMLLLSMQAAAFHASPYMYQPNKQVTEASFDGYEFAFEHRNEETAFLSFRKGPRRFIDAYYGRYTARAGLDFPGYRHGVTGEVFNSNISTHYDEDRYFVVRDTNYKNEVIMYDGLQYTQEGFDQLERQRSIHKVTDNGEVRLYLIRNS